MTSIPRGCTVKAPEKASESYDGTISSFGLQLGELVYVVPQIVERQGRLRNLASTRPFQPDGLVRERVLYFHASGTSFTRIQGAICVRRYI